MLCAVLELAFHDLKDAEHPELQAEALAFFESEDFEIFCDWLQWDAERVRGDATPSRMKQRQR